MRHRVFFLLWILSYALGADDCSGLLQTGIARASMAAGEYATIENTSIENATMEKLTTTENTTLALFKAFEICGKCNSFERFGDAHDGGYVMCTDGLRSGSLVAAYSAGVFTHDGWADDVSSKLGLPVHQFDCTVSQGTNCTTCKFFKQCIVSQNGQTEIQVNGINGDGGNINVSGWTLEQALLETGHSTAADGSLLMKMDIEGSEWDIFANEPPAALRKFNQLLMEFHHLHKETEHARYLAAMQHILAAGFKVAHIHGNNCCSVFKLGDVVFPRNVEVTFIRGDGRPDGCLDHQEYLGFDASNLAERPEIPLAHMR